MVYEYQCPNCNNLSEVIKPISEYDSIETCKLCNHQLNKILSPGYFLGEKVEAAYYSHALGKVVNNSKEEKRMASKKGLVEVGNEDLSKHVKQKETKYPEPEEILRKHYNG